jgi:triosephosphate isomerase (TIM)
MRLKIAAGNWKMNTTFDSGLKLIEDIKSGIGQLPEDVKVVFGVPYITLAAAAKAIEGNDKLNIAAQNCYTEESGAFTGEISVDMIKSTGAKYVIIGHSERREYFGENEVVLSLKVDLALSHELTPIYCCGEQLVIRQENDHFKLVQNQIEGGLFHLDAATIKKVVIAYEPVWAIGTGVTATPEEAQEMHAFIRQLLSKKYGAETANEISILYGGSVNAKNAAELFAKPDVDGGLVGGASLKAPEFLSIIHAF